MTRKEAIEAVRNNWPDSNYSMLREALQTLIPELAESEDEKIRKMLIEIVNITPASLAIENRSELLAYLEKQKEQKPVEWSEEDLQHKSWILECLADGKRKMPEYAEDFRAAYNWLKSLRPQLKREDWTDEDSIAIKEIQNALQIYMINNGISEEQRKKLARWLDIHCKAYPIPAKLYPHWKPSKEQMNALQAFVGMIHPDARYNEVLSLLNDLKKL